MVEWYHLKEGQEPIARTVIESGLYNKETKVEVYLVELKLATFRNINNVIIKEFSKETTLGKLIPILIDNLAMKYVSTLELLSISFFILIICREYNKSNEIDV